MKEWYTITGRGYPTPRQGGPMEQFALTVACAAGAGMALVAFAGFGASFIAPLLTLPQSDDTD